MMQRIRFFWYRLRRKLHWIGWHGKMCRSYKSVPFAENKPRCEVTGKFCRPSRLQKKYSNLSPTARRLIYGK